MAGNSFGKIFRITTFGESHGSLIGVVIDGCPAGLPIDLDYINAEMDRRKPGQSNLTTSRKEHDIVEIVSGVFEGYSTGTPICIQIQNKDQRSTDYDKFKGAFRSSHADFTYQHKYGLRDHRGGGRASARETACRVAAGAVAKLILHQYGVKINAYVSQVGHITCDEHYSNLNFTNIENNAIRCPDNEKAHEMISFIEKLKNEGDSVGGKVSCVISHVPIGLGEPVYDKLEAELAKAMLSINASKGFEIGSGFSAASMKGSEHNDEILFENKDFKFKSNHAGGVLGGISNGEDICFNVAFKPTSTISQNDEVIDEQGKIRKLNNKEGRHDPCIVPRAVPVVEAMSALVLADLLLQSRNSKL